MCGTNRSRAFNLSWLLCVFVFLLGKASCAVTYDRKAIVINGQRRILISGSIHYPRSVPEMWPDLIQKAKDGGLDVIQTYVFWNGHEPSRGTVEMQRFTQKIVSMMKSEGLFEWQGGPIILSQIENEFGPMEYNMGAAGKSYAYWAAKMAVGLNTGVPWVMCKETDAPDPVIDTCNGYYCDYFSPNKPYKPKMWTEAWTGWYTEFGGAVPHRPVEDMAFSVARFIQKGGSFINYYMYHGGTNFGRTAGGPFIATSYDYDAPIDEFGMLRQPKWGHLKDLHRAIKLSEKALVSSDPVATSLGSYQQSYVYRSAGACAAFLSNYNPNSYAKVAFNGMHYDLPPWSISILPDCRNAVYNTAKIGSQTSQMNMVPAGSFSWQSYNEETNSFDDSSFTTVGMLEQINVTRDTTDYLCVNIDQDENFLKTGQYPALTVFSAGHALHVFINGQLSGSVYGSLEGPKLTYSGSAKLWAGRVLGPVVLNGLNEGKRDLTWQKWTYTVGLKGEALKLHSLSGSSSVEWMEGRSMSQKQPLTWYKAFFNAPGGVEPLALDMNSMGKGQVWINGQSIGRYWAAYKASGNCGGCSYTGTFNENKCRTNCGEASQRWYHVPRSWLNPTGNLIVVFEEWDGNPNGIALVKRTESLLQNCVGQNWCSVAVTPEVFGGDPCPGVMKKLSVEAICQ
ncbi:hypothetical protein QJS04_geneDACA022071 [Acorus gramineus]|uniref:Beta-galactosidase n=1 Tax=Acorus gramineus TaxID=55184 RepID=A0AAV9A359_ACOGR|nr:hypothetical protein QJS04_geneDACA022071 [Acorus gramineus]